MSQIIDVLSEQVKTAEKLIERAKAIPKGKPSMYMIGFIDYDNEYTEPLTRETDSWEMETKEYLFSFYGDNSRQQKEFQKLITPKNQYMDFRANLLEELNQCIGYLNALIKAEKIKPEITRESTIMEPKKTPMIFISHSSKDKEFAEALVTLLEDIGFDSTNLFCSSVDGYGIGLSEDIFNTIRNLFNEHNLFVIYIHSPQYYNSPISLNEMGAAWVLKSDFCSFLTTDMDFDMMKGVVNNSTISIKVDGVDSATRLTELKNKLLLQFELRDIDSTKWERKRKAFLDKVCSINIRSTRTGSDQPATKDSLPVHKSI